VVVSVSHPIDASDTREGRTPMSFRFSLQAVQAGSRREWIELVKRTDGAGFDMLVTADHLDGCLSPFSPLATAAEVSDRLRLGVLVLNNDFYSPSVLAREAATLDLLSDGRVEIGLGAGHAKPEYDRAGITFDSAPTRVDRLEEAVVILRRLFDREVVTFSGRHYRLVEERCDPAPLQAHLPLLVGGGGRRVLGIGARHADAVGFTGLGRILADGQHHDPNGFRPQRVDQAVDWIRSEAGSRIRSLELQALVQKVVVTDNARGVAADIAQKALPSLSADDVLTTPYLMIGSAPELIERLLGQRERWGFTHYTLRRDALSQIEPVVAALVGR
jgi:probable F420-dependent oxidoreductase